MRGNNGGMWQVILPLFSSFIAPVKFPPDGLPLAACPGARSSNEYDKDEEVRHTQKAQTSSQDTGGKDEDFRVCVCVCVCGKCESSGGFKGTWGRIKAVKTLDNQRIH